MLGVLATKWTIRLALACYVAYLAAWLAPLGPRWQRHTRNVWARNIWTGGCVLFVVHVALAFHFYHQWSHTIAWQHTAERTKELLGVAVGNGIYFSYLFLLVWVMDVAWLWRVPFGKLITNGTPTGVPHLDASAVPGMAASRSGTPVWRGVVHVFLLFVAVNGAIIFEAGPTRWAGIAACLALGALAIGRAGKWFSPREPKCPVGPRESAITPREEVLTG